MFSSHSCLMTRHLYTCLPPCLALIHVRPFHMAWPLSTRLWDKKLGLPPQKRGMYSHSFGYLNGATMKFQRIGTGGAPLRPSLQASQGPSEHQPQSFNSPSSQKDQKQLLELQIWIRASKTCPRWGWFPLSNAQFVEWICAITILGNIRIIQKRSNKSGFGLWHTVTNFRAVWPRKTWALGNSYHFTISNDSIGGGSKLSTFR